MSYLNQFGSRRDRDGLAESDLQDQVRRLTAVVREYQRRYLPIEERSIEDAPLAPWMTDPSILSPLLIEYDSNIKALREQIKTYKEEFDNLQEKSKKIVDENNRLHRELRSTIENQLEVLQQSDGMNSKTQIQLDHLQQKVARISDEKEKLSLSYEECSRELQQARAELRNKTQENVILSTELARTQDDLKSARSFAEELQKTNKRLKTEHDQFLRNGQVQDSEMDELKSKNRKLLAEIKTYKSLNNEVQSHNNKLQDQVRFMDRDTFKETITEKSAEGTIRKLQNEIVELDSRVTSYSKELSKLRYEKSDLEQQLTSLQKKNIAIEENEHQAILRVKDSVQLVENALLEREQAIIREQQKSQEVVRLQQSINNLMKQADAQRKKEVSNVKMQLNKQIQQLMGDLQDYELDSAEKQINLEKIQREKSSLEKELEKMYLEGPEEVFKCGKTFDELQRRFAKVELSRDEAVLQVEQLEATVRRNKSRYENDLGAKSSQINDFKKQVKLYKNDLDKVTESRVQLLDELNTVRKEFMIKCEDNANLDMSCVSQVAQLQQKLDLKKREFESRLHAAEESHKQSINELREMLSEQQKLNSRSREESKLLNQKVENTVSQLRKQNSQLKRQNKDLTTACNDIQHKYEEVEREYYMTQVALGRLHHLHTDSEERADIASLQVQTFLGREEQLLNNRKSLNREVDKMLLDRPTKSIPLHSSMAD